MHSNKRHCGTLLRQQENNYMEDLDNCVAECSEQSKDAVITNSDSTTEDIEFGVENPFGIKLEMDIKEEDDISEFIPISTSCESCKLLHEKIDALLAQNKMILEILGKHTTLLNTLERREQGISNLSSKFPIQTEKALIAVNEEINEENSTEYISTIKYLLNGDPCKHFESIISRKMCMDYNILGVHGKKSLKTHTSFYNVLICAISANAPCPEKELAKAFQVVKKRHFRLVSTANAKENKK